MFVCARRTAAPLPIVTAKKSPLDNIGGRMLSAGTKNIPCLSKQSAYAVTNYIFTTGFTHRSKNNVIRFIIFEILSSLQRCIVFCISSNWGLGVQNLVENGGFETNFRFEKVSMR